MEPLTEEQIEAAARKRCELDGAFPDERIPDCRGHIPDLYFPRWTYVAREIRTADRTACAIDHVRQTEERIDNLEAIVQP